MSGRLNPRDYDLGELRDAVQEIPRSHASEEFPPDNSRTSPEREHAIPVESPKTAEAELGASGTASHASDHPDESADETDMDDVERYLQSRHRHRSETSEQRPPDRTGGREHRRSEQPKQQPAQNLDTFFAELSGTDLTKPYLERIPDAYSAQLEVFEWLDEMLSRAGEEATVSALEYYEDIGWLSEGSREELEDITAGLSTADTIGQRLNIDDHRESLLYVARLARRLDN